MIKSTSTFALLAAFMLAPAAMAETVSQPGFSRSRVCYMDKYKETYVPGTERSPGYVTSKKVRVEVDCEKYARKHNVERYRRSDSRYYWDNEGRRTHPHNVKSYRHDRPGNYYSRRDGVWYHSESYRDRRDKDHVDDNSCVEGTVLGGILGGGVAAGVSKSDAYAWSIPLGVVTGALVGCQVDGG